MKLNTNFRLFCIAPGALALDSAERFAADAPKIPDGHGISESVDVAAHTLVVSDLKNKSGHKFLWNDQTKFTEHGKTATTAALKAGEGEKS